MSIATRCASRTSRTWHRHGIRLTSMQLRSALKAARASIGCDRRSTIVSFRIDLTSQAGGRDASAICLNRSTPDLLRRPVFLNDDVTASSVAVEQISDLASGLLID